jgi:hypothetical protein
VKTVDVVEGSIPRFRNDRQRPWLESLALFHRPGNRRIADDADAVCVGDEDGPLEKAPFIDPRGARHLPVAVL